MTMIPRSPILRRLIPIRLAPTRRDGTLRQSRHAIFPAVVPLPHPMPMHACPIILQLILHLHLDHVAPVCENSWTHVLAVDEESLALDAVGSRGAVGDGEVVVAGHACVRPVIIEVCADVEALGPAAPTFWAILGGVAGGDGNGCR